MVMGGAASASALLTGSVGHASGMYLVPAEEAPHHCTFMQWPVTRAVYRDRYFRDDVQQTIADIANTIAEFESVVMLGAQTYHRAMRALLSERVEIWDVPTDDLWCRDSGPIFAINPQGDLAITKIQFNGWGNKQTHHHDAQIARRVAERLGLSLRETGLKGEGGGLDHDGHGLLIAHESSWLGRSRNPGLRRDEIETRLLAAYGADRMIWAKGVAGEDITDYHIDSLARFTGPGRVLINLPHSPDFNDPFHVAAFDTADILEAAGIDVEIINEPHHPRVQSFDFVASYANYYVCNDAVIMAEFGDAERDEAAARILARHYPGREIVALNVDPLGDLGGGIHCATQQMPTT